MNYKSVLLISTLPILFTACSEESSSKKRGSSEIESAVPTQLHYTKPTPGTQITKEQAQEIKNIFKHRSTFRLPPGELLFPDKEQTALERVALEQKLAKEDPAAHQLLMDLRSNCQFQEPQSKVISNLPAGKIVTIEQMNTGDYTEYSISSGISGTNCPVNYVGALEKTITMKDQDRSKDLHLSSTKTGIKGKAMILKPEYAQKLSSRGLLVDADMSGLSISKEKSNQGHEKSISKFNLSGTYYTLTQEVPYTSQVQILSDKSSTSGNRTQMILKTTLTINNAPVTFESFSINEGQKTTSLEMYLNGNPATIQEVRELFGDINASPLGAIEALQSISL